MDDMRTTLIGEESQLYPLLLPAALRLTTKSTLAGNKLLVVPCHLIAIWGMPVNNNNIGDYPVKKLFVMIYSKIHQI